VKSLAASDAGAANDPDAYELPEPTSDQEPVAAWNPLIQAAISSDASSRRRCWPRRNR
jgi:hypothetical protein